MSAEDLTWEEAERLLPVVLEMAHAHNRGELTGPEIDALVAMVQSLWEYIAPMVAKMWGMLEPMLIDMGQWPPGGK